MLQNPCKTLGFMENVIYKTPPGGGGGGGKPYLASGQTVGTHCFHQTLELGKVLISRHKPFIYFHSFHGYDSGENILSSQTKFHCLLIAILIDRVQ